jgi:hypothetical protein
MHIGMKRIFDEASTASDVCSPVPHKIRKDNQSIMFAPKLKIKNPVKFNKKHFANFFNSTDVKETTIQKDTVIT